MKREVSVAHAFFSSRQVRESKKNEGQRTTFDIRTVWDASRRQSIIHVLRSLLSCFSASAHPRNRIQGPIFFTFVERKSAAIFRTHLKWTRIHKLATWGSRFWPHFLGTQSRQWMTRLCAHGRAHMGQRQGIRSQDRARRSASPRNSDGHVSQ